MEAQNTNVGTAVTTSDSRRLLPALSTLVIGTVIAIVMLVVSRSWEETRAQAEWAQVGITRGNALERHLNSIVDATYGCRGFFAGSGRVDAREFAKYMAHDTASYVGSRSAEAFGWAPRVTEANRAQFEAVDAPKDYVEGFRITRSDGLSSDPSTVYYPVYYHEPMDNPELVAGEDVLSSPILREAIERARDTGEPALAGHISDMHGTAGIRVVGPIYKNGTRSDNVRDRRQNIAGVTMYVHEVEDIFNEAIDARDSSPIGVHNFAYDVANASSPVEMHKYLSPRSDRKQIEVEGYRYEHTFEVGGRTWSLVSTATPYWVDNAHTAQPWILLIVILIATIVTSIILYRVLEKGKQVAVMAGELQQSHASLELRVEERTADAVKAQEDSEKAFQEAQAALDGLQEANSEIKSQGQAIMDLSTPVINM
jgi:CHASE1-domain containing sensor protein